MLQVWLGGAFCWQIWRVLIHEEEQGVARRGVMINEIKVTETKGKTSKKNNNLQKIPAVFKLEHICQTEYEKKCKPEIFLVMSNLYICRCWAFTRNSLFLPSLAVCGWHWHIFLYSTYWKINIYNFQRLWIANTSSTNRNYNFFLCLVQNFSLVIYYHAGHLLVKT